MFLKDLKLDLSIEKTLITNARAERAKFLGKKDGSEHRRAVSEESEWEVEENTHG